MNTLSQKFSLHLAGAISLLSYIFLSFLSSSTERTVPLELFYLCLSIPWISLIVLYLRRSQTVSFSLKSVIIWAALFRIAGIFATPIYEDDYFRFLWDGYRFAESGDPYQGTPLEHFGDPNTPQELEDILSHVNHPDLPTIYGPPMEYIFLLSHKLWPASLISLKLIFLLIEAIMLFALWRILTPRNFLLASWCPLLVIETSFQAHPDIIGISFLSLGLMFATRHRPFLSMVGLGLATSAKIFGILALPFWLERKHWFKQCLIFTAAALVLYASFLLRGSDSGLTSLRAMAREWEFNSAAFAIVKIWLPSASARLLCLALFAIIYFSLLFTYWRSRYLGKTSTPPLDIIYACFFLLSPVINPWYLLWMFPFVMLTPRCWSITALAFVSLSYITGLNLQNDQFQNFENPLIIKYLEFGAIAIALGVDLIRTKKSAQ